jgi:hypothetical protein
MKLNEMNFEDTRMKVLTMSEMNRVRGGDDPVQPIPPIHGGK